MNRRKKKKPQVDHLAAVKTKLQSIDFIALKTSCLAKWQRLPKLHQRMLTVLIPILVILLFIPIPESQPEIEMSTPAQRVEIDINATSLSEQNSAKTPELASDTWQEYEVKSGDTLARVFRSNDLPMGDLNALVKVEGNDRPLSDIKQGQLVRFKLAADGQLDILQLEKSGQSVMFFRLSDGGFGRSK